MKHICLLIISLLIPLHTLGQDIGVGVELRPPTESELTSGLGDQWYYIDRHLSFQRRYPELKTKTPVYYAYYGYYYHVRLMNICDSLSPQGQNWVKCILHETQLSLQHFLIEQPEVELKSEILLSLMYKSTIDIWLRNGICFLPQSDLTQILMCTRWEDLLCEDGRRLLSTLQKSLIVHYENYPAEKNSAKIFLEENLADIMDVWQEKSQEDRKAKRLVTIECSFEDYSSFCLKPVLDYLT